MNAASRPRLIVALDVPRLDQALELVARLRGLGTAAVQFT